MTEDHYPTGRAGFSKIFHIETMRRIPVEQDQFTKDMIGATTHEGRIFPQALSDEFGKLREVERIVLRTVHKKEHFAVADDDEAHLLEVSIYGKEAVPLHMFLVNMHDLRNIHTSGWHSFRAGESAQELVRLFRQIKGQ